MEKSWNFWNFEISGISWKVMEFWLILWRVMENSWDLTNKLLILMNRRRYVAAFQNATNMYVDIEVMEFCDMVMEKSWNFVVKISWQPWFKCIIFCVYVCDLTKIQARQYFNCPNICHCRLHLIGLQKECQILSRRRNRRCSQKKFSNLSQSHSQPKVNHLL